MKRILLGLPNTGYYHFTTFSSIVSLEIPKDVQISFRFVSNCLIYDARESLVKYAIENNYDYILMIDSDMVLPLNTIVNLLNLVENKGYDLATGLIFKRSHPFQPCFYIKARIKEDKGKFIPLLEGIIKWDKGEVYNIEACGLACCMIKVEALKSLETPMFYPFPDIGEDITFCIKFRQKGFKLALDTNLDIGHLSTFPIDSRYQQEALSAWMNDPSNQGKLLYKDEPTISRGGEVDNGT